MTTLIKVGNSQGVRIPKAIIKQAHLENEELEFKVLEEGLLIKPVSRRRAGWKEKFDQAQAQLEIQDVDREWLDAPLNEDENWEW